MNSKKRSALRMNWEGVQTLSQTKRILTRSLAKTVIQTIHHIIDILKNSLRGNPDRRDSVSLHVFISLCILDFARIVVRSVNLDAQLYFVHIEIHDVWSVRILAPNRKTELLSAKSRPEHLLRKTHVCTQLFGAL